MTIDYRKLLKDCIRGQIWTHDVPVPPGAVDASGEQTESTREELELFFDLLAEVIGEEGESRQFIIREIARLEWDYLGRGNAPMSGGAS
jgi:hypothetical protein